MNWFTSFVTAISAAGICLGGLYIICPTGKISKTVKYVFSLCFLLIIITTAGVTVKNSDFDFPQFTQNEIDSDAAQLAAARYVYENALYAAGIEFSEIRIFTDKSQDGSINITKILIYTKAESKKVREALGQAAENFEVEVINE